jgi:hypothetical protein
MLRKIATILALFGLLTAARAEKSLGELASEAGVEWLLGQWQLEGDDADGPTLVFKGELDNHVVAVTYKDQRSETKGMIFLPPGTIEPKYYSGDDKGGVGIGAWSVEDNKAVLKNKHTDSEGRTIKMAITFEKLDDKSMEVKIFDLDDQNKLGSDARMTAKFVRKK